MHGICTGLHTIIDDAWVTLILFLITAMDEFITLFFFSSVLANC